MPLEKMLDVRLLMSDKKHFNTANIFGFIAYNERNPYMVKVLRDVDFWNSLNARTDGWILYAIKPEGMYYGGVNAKYINDSLGLKPEDYPQLVILSIGTDRVLKQRNYPICDDSIDAAYKSIEQSIGIVTQAVQKILPQYKGSTNVSREVWDALDAELATERWKRVTEGMCKVALSLIKRVIGTV